MKSTAVKLFSLLFFFLITFFGFAQSEQEADALVETEEYEAALEIYSTLRGSFIQEKNYNDYLRISIKEGILQQDLGAYEVAKFILKNTLIQTKDHLPIDTTTALVYHKLGVSHYYLEEYDRAIQNWEQAIEIRGQYFPSNHNDIAKGYKNIGSAYEELAQINTSKEFYKKGIDLLLSNANADQNLLAQTYRDLGAVISSQSDIETAKVYYQTALKIYEDIFQEEPWNLGIVYSDLSSFYLDIEDYQEVIKYSEKTLQSYADVSDKYDEDYWAMADAYNNMSTAYLGLGELSKNDSLFEKAINPLKKAININLNFPEARRSYKSINRSNLAVVYKYLKDYTNAHKEIERAISIDRELNANTSLAINTNNRGEIYFDQENYRAALIDFQTAAQLLVADFNSINFSDNPNIRNSIIQDKISLVEILQNKAKTLRLISKENTYQQLTLSTYDSLFVLINLMQNEVETDGSKRFLAAKSKAIFEAAIQSNLDYYNQTQQEQYLARVFELAEQSKAVSLLDQLSESQAKSQANIPDELLQREQSLKRQIKTLEQEIFEAEKAKESSVDLRTQLIASNRQLEKLIDTLEQQYAIYHKLKYALTATNLTSIQQEILAPNQAMIQYFIGDSSLFILYSDNNQSKAVKKALPKDLLQQIEHFRRAIIEQNMEVENYQNIAYSLYQLLFADVLPKSADNQRLIIIPDGVLAYLPFEILTTEFIEGENDFRFLPYLLKKYAISYSYSASVLAKQQNYRSEAKKYLASFAPSYEEKLVENDQLTRLLVRSGNYNLPGALEEVKAVKELMGGDLFQETQATERLFKSIAQQYKNLHLSMHGIVNDSFPLRSKLLFYETQNDSIEDASLFAYELYNMQLNSDLVVLSACNTGMGQLQKGEGVMSLSHAFAYAGVASTVMSLWQVPDASTSTLIQEFYRNLKTELPKDVAMQQAKLNFLENTISLKQAHPFYWAALLNYGNQSVIDLPQKSMVWIWSIVGLGILLSLFIFWKKRQIQM